MLMLMVAVVLAGLSLPARAEPPLQFTLQGSVQVAFAPGDDTGALITETLRKAKSQILVQAYSFTHQAIADALVTAQASGIDVRVIADPEQHGRIATSLLGHLADHGVRVWLDGEHAAAHDKVMIIDPDTPDATLITGSFNFSHAAQYRNAENLLVLRGTPLLVQAYAANWRRHRSHALPMRPTSLTP